ncbi:MULTISPECIES: DUF5996 family protein [unclassified Thioalkalivibrio]|uniref:DUF5996 family protein n=1 Tax=unclassified Thioalkalivibrio TaxID=2621013 RepID=UPI00039F67A8|nr:MULTISPECIES: DUF5996 family protein [unclassified Thioalkalivibrio]
MPAHSQNGPTHWPELPPLDHWEDTCTTVHMWTQIVGKIRLELGPWVNHSWGSTLYVTSTGLTTSPIPYQGQTFTIDFNFVTHQLVITTSHGRKVVFSLEPMSVADFHDKIFGALAFLGIRVAILARPVEVPEATPFARNTQNRSYDHHAIHAFWQALVQANTVFSQFRAGFRGKCSPVHFFWGAFDLAVTRFSGREAPKHPGGVPNCADWVMEEAYSHELASAGFWPGTGLGEAAFYAYAYPEPDGYREAAIQPAAARFHEGLGEYILPFDAVRASTDPDAALLSFLQSTYQAAADNGGWDHEALEFLPPNSR